MGGTVKKLRCKTCRGVYFDTDESGTFSYYHACPLLSVPEYDALPPPQRATTSPGALREGHRDENVTTDARGRANGMKSSGQGFPDEI